MVLQAVDTEPSRSRPLLIGVAVVALLAAGIITYARRGSDEDSAAPPVSELVLVCMGDGHSFTLTPDQYSEELRKAPRSEEMTRGQTPRIRCPKCNQYSVVHGARCPKDGTAFALVSKNAQPPQCPKCGWMP